MPTLQADDIPPSLKPYIFYGVKLKWTSTSKEAVADCPWCGSDNKFTVNIDRGVWRCLKCNEGTEKGKVINGGNITTFIRKLDELSLAETKSQDYEALAKDRRLLNHTTPLEWGLSKSIITNEWLIPGFNTEGAMTTLYKYGYNYETKRTMLWPAPTIGHKLFGMQMFNHRADIIYILEGLWDTLAFWEVAIACKQRDINGEDLRLMPTSNRNASLLGNANVLGIASNLAFSDKWATDIFHNKIVNFMCQNDHPGKNKKTGAPLPPASYMGMERIAKLLSASATPPIEMNVLLWGEHGYDLKKPSGYDIRDHLAGV